MGNKALYLIVGLVVIGGIITTVILIKPKTAKSPTNTDTASVSNTNAITNSPLVGKTFTFDNPKKSAHYETNTPAHGMVQAAVPINVVIDFNFDLSTVSTISIVKDGVEYGTGTTTVDANKLSMRRAMNSESPDGKYTVSYNACWPDKSCHDGHFQFAVDRSLVTSYMDLRGQSAVTVSMRNLAFSPMDIRISTGTMVAWKNDDTEVHYVNTDSHPAHTYYPDQNSSALNPGDQFSQTFATTGAYPYHCSAHAGVMTGSIIVE